MRAHLARHARRVVLHPRPPACALYAAPRRWRQPPVTTVSLPSRRTIFEGVFKKAPREVRQPEFEPGWMNIMVWRSRTLDQLRPPPTPELVKAWRAFFDSKRVNYTPLNATQALQCHRLLNYFLEQPDAITGARENAPSDQLSFQNLYDTLLTLRRIRPRERTEEHLEFVKALYSALMSDVFEAAREPDLFLLQSRYMIVLSRYGGSKDALKILYDNWSKAVPSTADTDMPDNLLVPVMQGLANDGHEAELVELVRAAEAAGISYRKAIQSVMVKFFIEQSRANEVKEWFDKPIQTGRPDPALIPQLASFAVRSQEQDWAISHFLTLGDSKPEKVYWDSLLRAILVIRKDLSQVESMMHHMFDQNGPVKIDIATINGMLRTAVELQDTSLAEDILSLAASQALQYDGETFLILMEIRMDAGYLPGVSAAYKKVRFLQPWQTDSNHWWEYGPLFNRYLRELASQKTPEFRAIGELIEHAEEDQLLLEPETVSMLCIKFLENEQHFDAMDLLSTYAFRYSAREREVIQDAFVQFCFNTKTSTSRAWSGYQILRQFFQDLSFDHRTRLVQSFFERGRPDMASHVFGHMRQHRNKDYHPARETYIAFFEGLGQHPDEEALDMVYNMFKMDMTIEPNTRLYTSLILAHASCERSHQAMEFWAAITKSKEGPSYNSIEAMFYALERMPDGASHAHRIWKKMERMDVEMPQRVYNAYIGAIAGSGDVQGAQKAIMRNNTLLGNDPEATTLGVAYNALPGQQLQKDFQSWANMRYPEIWKALEKKGRRMNQDSLCKFKLNRVIKA